LKPSTQFDPAAGYLYGRFALTHKPKHSLFKMGLILSGPEDAEVRIELRSRDAKVFAVKPGMYSINKIVLASDDNETMEEIVIPPGRLKPFMVEPGKSYYLGDLYCRVYVSNVIREFVEYTFEVHSFQNSYDETTATLKSRFPALAHMENVDVIGLLPQEPLARDR
jgi:hypothetical protein